MMAIDPLDSDYWESKRPRLENIDVPAFVIASWSDQGLHTRRTLEAFDRIGSEHKFLEVHGRRKWEYYHQPSTVTRQKQFFDRYLNDLNTEVESWPRVRMEMRRSFYSGLEWTASEWPVVGSEYVTLALDARTGSMMAGTVEAPGSISYDSAAGQAVFDHTSAAPVDVVGGMRLRLSIEAAETNDFDVFVAAKKLDAVGELVDFTYANVLEKGPVALGWLRASHREVDDALSTPNRPWHPHAREQLTAPATIVGLDVEIWPSGTRFEAGETLRLIARWRRLPRGRTVAPCRHPQHGRSHGVHRRRASFDPRFFLAARFGPAGVDEPGCLSPSSFWARAATSAVP